MLTSRFVLLPARFFSVQNAKSEVCLPVPQNFKASTNIDGVRSCGERQKQEPAAREACLNAAAGKFGSSAKITLLQDPPKYVADVTQRSVCKKRIPGRICVDYGDECEGTINADCSVKVCF